MMDVIHAYNKRYKLEDAFSWCEQFARSHYENFPVGSLLIPRAIRPHFYSIYAYSRTADDIADEGGLEPAERLALLDDWEQQLDAAYRGEAEHPIFQALAETVRKFQIPIEPFRHLLRAFRMDALNQGYETTTDLLYYCHHSANPVGRLVLHLFGLHTEERTAHSDAICTGLQMANFWQDISVDIPRGRINIPRESMRYFEYSLEELDRRIFNDNFREMIAYHVDHAMNRFQHGYPLMRSVPTWGLRTELGLVFLGGVRVLHRIKAMDYNVLAERPTLRLSDRLWMLVRLGTL